MPSFEKFKLPPITVSGKSINTIIKVRPSLIKLNSLNILQWKFASVYIHVLHTAFMAKANTMNPNQTAPKISLSWKHNVCK